MSSHFCLSSKLVQDCVMVVTRICVPQSGAYLDEGVRQHHHGTLCTASDAASG